MTNLFRIISKVFISCSNYTSDVIKTKAALSLLGHYLKKEKRYLLYGMVFSVCWALGQSVG